MHRAEEWQPDCADGVGCQFHQRIAAQAGLWDSLWLAKTQSKIPLCVGAEWTWTPKGGCQRKGEGEREVRVSAAWVSITLTCLYCLCSVLYLYEMQNNFSFKTEITHQASSKMLVINCILIWFFFHLSLSFWVPYTDLCLLTSRPCSCVQQTPTPPRWTLSCSVVWEFSSTSAESTTRRWTVSPPLSPSHHRLVLTPTPSLTSFTPHPLSVSELFTSVSLRTTCCGISWAPRWRMEAAQRRQWPPTGELWNCSQVSSAVATTWESAALT